MANQESVLKTKTYLEQGGTSTADRTYCVFIRDHEHIGDENHALAVLVYIRAAIRWSWRHQRTPVKGQRIDPGQYAELLSRVMMRAENVRT
jgi:hypothetical protein